MSTGRSNFHLLSCPGVNTTTTISPICKLDGRVALVIGSGQGMGLGVVRALLRQFKDLADEDFERQLDLNLSAMNNFGYDGIAKRTTAVGRAGTSEDVGAAVAYLVSNEASWMSGQVIALNGGSTTA